MIHEYIITAFKVMVGVITENRIALSALIALGVLFVWILLSLVFSFQGKFASNVKRINEYVSRNGIKGEAKQGLELLLVKMPSEFQKGYKKYEKTPSSLPSDHIKRFESFDMELSGGVFNQNKSVIKTFINFVFVSLSLFSLAILPIDEVLSGYNLAEALVIPLIFFIIAKIMYYVYTAIRQHQYKVAVQEFNYMLENMDRASNDFASNEVVNKNATFDNYVFNQNIKTVENVEERHIEENQNLEFNSEDLTTNEEKNEQVVEQKEAYIEEHIDNFIPDFDNLLEGEEIVEQKRGRGRPRKEVVNNGEFVITNDKEFEDALLRAEKLMRKNEEPLSASQTKRIEKQIKELVDAMTKYKEGK